MADITIDDIVLKGFISYGTSNYGNMLTNLENRILMKHSGNEELLENTLRLCLNSVKLFIGAYNATLKKLQDLNLLRSDEETAIQFGKIISLYAASTSALNYLNGSQDVEMDNSAIQLVRSRFQDRINLSMDDYNLIAEVIDDLTSAVSSSYDLSLLRFDFISYYYNIAQFTTKQSSRLEYQKYLPKVRGTNIVINNNSIPCLKPLSFSKKQSQKNIIGRDDDPKAMFKRPLEEYTFDLVERNQIIGNDNTLNELEKAVDCLLMYDKRLKRNPYLDDGGFRQRFLLAGLGGIGKTLSIKYAMSYAKRLSQKQKIDLFFAKFDFENPYQDGGLAALQHMINVVNQGDRTYIIFFDELDTRFPSTSQNVSFHSQQVLGEILRWLDGAYENKANYIIAATCNQPNRLHLPLLRRFKEGLYVLEPPDNPEDLAKIFYVHLKPGIDGSYVQIKDWLSLGKIALEYGLYPSDIADISKSLIEKSRTYDFPSTIHTADYAQKSDLIKQNHQLITDQIILAASEQYFEENKKMVTNSNRFAEMNRTGLDPLANLEHTSLVRG